LVQYPIKIANEAFMNNPGEYRPRLVDIIIKQYLRTFGAIEIVGCKWCGKTWTAVEHGNSVLRLDDEQTKALIEADISLAFEGERPRVIDEWHVVPRIWNAARRKVDEAGGKKGLYILTGSTLPADKDDEDVQHSGAGRIAVIRMRPMSLSETGESDGAISLAGLFNGEFTKGPVKTDLRVLARYICNGGWPGALDIEHYDDRKLIPVQYLDNLLSRDVVRKGLNRHAMRRLLLALARSVG
jgi:predicted AAA+ superfamily ATPase